MAQASTSTLSRYHPAVISLAAIAAGCGIYALSTVYITRTAPASPLRRSNAVHRPRRDRERDHGPSIEWMNATPDAPLGTIVIRSRDDNFIINLARSTFPTLDELRHLFSQANEDVRRELADVAIDMILTTCYVATQHRETYEQVRALGFGPLLDAMSVRDEAQVRRCSHLIQERLQLAAIGDEQLQQAVERFLASDKWEQGLESGSEDDAVDPAETEDFELLNAANREPSQGLRGLLYYIAEEDARRKAYEHRGIHCEECGEQPIRGVRWHCLNCPDFDLCSSCEMSNAHPKTHIFAKVKIPLPVLSQPIKEYKLWYPGDPRKLHPPLDSAVKKRLCQQHGFEEPQMDALYDQFTCIANVPGPAGTSGVKAMIDRRAFNKALTCEKWPHRFAANAMYDRMFAFYDTDLNGLIDFEEFVGGLAYLRGPKRFASLQRTIRGYDIDDDGYVNRVDFLRLLKGKFDIQRQLVNDMIEGQEKEQTTSALETLRTSQPISSVFSQEDIPPGETRLRRGKQQDNIGDLLPLDDTRTILNDDDPWPKRTQPIREPSYQRLRRHLSRFEELINGTAEQTNEDSPQAAHQRATDMDIVDMGGNVPSRPLLPAGYDGEEGNLETASSRDHPSGRDLLPEDSFERLEVHIPDVLWKVTHRSLHDLLDPIFLAREGQDKEAIQTRLDREKWRREIDAERDAIENKKTELMNAAATDPLMATALQAFGQSNPPRAVNGVTKPAAGSAFTDDLVPTDWDSLERREQQVRETPLEQLLSATGYSMQEEDDVPAANVPPRMAHPGASPIWNGGEHHSATSPLRSVLSTAEPILSVDPTLPQNRPNTETETTSKSRSPSPPMHSRRSRGKSAGSSKNNKVEQEVKEYNEKATKQYLKYLIQMDDIEREIQERGGVGRLTYDEVESIAVSESRGEVRGLIKSWLEWASF